ncbi:MAG: murein transglycosylase [Micromonosporaceae bacterium]
MVQAQPDDAGQTSDLEAVTAQSPRPPVPTETAPTEPVASHRRTPGVLLPACVFGVLLVVAALVGRYVIPTQGPGSASAPTAEATSGPATTTAAAVTPTAVGPTPLARPADGLSQWAGAVGRALNVPEVAIQAYGYAQYVVAQRDQSCHLSWTTLAGIGQVESQHGQAGGAVLEHSGRSAPPIVGPLLDGQGGRILVRDTDAGAFDGDPTYDRGMGPLLLVPSVWRTYAADADGDGILDPYDLDDSALALATLLCAGSEDLSKASGWNAAIARVHPGTTYAKSVFTIADDYGQRSRSVG